MGYFSNAFMNAAASHICTVILYILIGLVLLLLYGIPIGLGVIVFIVLKGFGEKTHNTFQRINAYVHFISLIASVVLITMYNIEPYRNGYTRASGVYAIFVIAITVITLIIGITYTIKTDLPDESTK